MPKRIPRAWSSEFDQPLLRSPLHCCHIECFISSLALYLDEKKNPCLSFSFYRPDYSEYNALELSKSLFETLQIFLEKFNMEGIKDAEASLHKT